MRCKNVPPPPPPHGHAVLNGKVFYDPILKLITFHFPKNNNNKFCLFVLVCFTQLFYDLCEERLDNSAM